MNSLSIAARTAKCVLGVLMVVSFFLPWVAQTPSCMNKTIVVRDNISGLTLFREGTTPEVILAPLFGAVVAAAALAIRGTRHPLTRSLVSLAEIPAAFFLFVYIDIAVGLFTPFVVRYGYVVTEILFWTILIVASGEVGIHFGLLKRRGRIAVSLVVAAYVLFIVIDSLTRLFT
jgi:hypothetical protein